MKIGDYVYDSFRNLHGIVLDEIIVTTSKNTSWWKVFYSDGEFDIIKPLEARVISEIF
jgi:hypothetical protein